jgi:AraC-like DNA-binding protein
MIMKHVFFYIISLLFVIDYALSGQENPFKQFAGKPYASYHYALRDTLRKRYPDAPAMALAVNQMRQLPDTYNNHQWQIEADFVQAKYAFKYQHGSDKVYLKTLNRLLQESRKYRNKVFELRIIRQLFDYYVDKGIPDKVEYTMQLERILKEVSPKDFPDIIDCKFRLGELYMNYNDYKRAEKYFNLVVSSPVNNEIQLIYVHARNDLGIIYRTYYHDYDESDKWFQSILDFDKKYGIIDKADRWRAVSTGNIGKNCFFRREYTRAISLMTKSVKYMYDLKDYSFTFDMAPTISQCYSALGQYDKAHEYILLAEKCIGGLSSYRHTEYEDLYAAKSKYYGGIGNITLAGLYVDSAYIEHSRIDNRYNMNKFMLLEQKTAQKELQQETNEKQIYQNRFTFFFILSIVIFISLVLYIILYFQKQKAYRLLVRKNQQWANKPIDGDPGFVSPKKESSEDENLWNTIKNYVETDQCFCNSTITLDNVAKDLGINRTYISNIINSHEENFSTFINRYRIRMAIQILSDNSKESIENIAEKVGFNNRKTFYNAFRNITGLSPSQFKDNIKSVCL